MSKVGIENYIKHFSKKNKNIKIITIRAGNVLGGGIGQKKIGARYYKISYKKNLSLDLQTLLDPGYIFWTVYMDICILQVE